MQDDGSQFTDIHIYSGTWTNILEAHDYFSEITGIAFPSDGTRIIFACQRDG